MKIKENFIMAVIFLLAMYLIVMTGCTVVTSDDAAWEWPKGYAKSNAEVSHKVA